VEDFSGGILAYLSVFLVGLGLNLTPCVYPMLSVTVAVFTHTESERTSQSFVKALVYVLGMASMYSALGVAAAFSGGILGGWLQHSGVLLVIAALILVLSLSMFGLYRLEVPSWLTKRLSRKRPAGFLGLYLSGLLVGVFAAPCIGPPVVALLAFVGSKQDPWLGFWIFFILSLGLGLPYLVLGTFSHLSRKLPKSGVWLVWVEHLFGVVLLAFAAYYYILAVNPDFLVFLLPVTLLFGGIYLGFVDKSGNERKGFRFFKWGTGCLALFLAGGLFFGQPGESVQWEHYTRERLTEARLSGQPVVVDFYADWCLPCHEMNYTTFRNPRVVEALDGFVRLKVDMTAQGSPRSRAIASEFDLYGVPTYLFFDAKGREVIRARRFGYVHAAEFLELIESVHEAGT